MQWTVLAGQPALEPSICLCLTCMFRLHAGYSTCLGQSQSSQYLGPRIENSQRRRRPFGNGKRHFAAAAAAAATAADRPTARQFHASLARRLLARAAYLLAHPV